MDSYSKTLNVNVNVNLDKQSKDATMKAIDDIQKEVDKEFSQLDIVKNGIISSTDIERVRLYFNEYKKNLKELETVKNEIAELERYDSKNAALTGLRSKATELESLLSQKESSTVNESKPEEGAFSQFKEGWKKAAEEQTSHINDFAEFGKKAFTKMEGSISKFAEEGLKKLKGFVNDAIDEIKSMSEFDLSGSSYFSKDAASLYRETGLTGSSAYGLSKALESQGFSSFDDFISNIDLMNENQLSYMKEIAEISEKEYDESIEMSRQFDEFSKEYDIFKREMQQSFISFFMENKDAIMNGIKFIMSCLDGLLKLTDGIFSLFSSGRERTDSERTQATADILGLPSTTNVANDRSINISNTFNGISQKDQTWLANAGQLTYQQVIAARR